MSGWIIVQIILNITFVAAALVCWARLNRPQKDDPRLSRGLQLLQSKIAILEDLSDRTDLQVKQLATLLEQKGKEVQECIMDAQAEMQKVEKSVQRNLEVSKIFQEKIPHKEIVERQNTRKYVQAARLAHQGMGIDEIAEKIDIPRSELDFIVKVNREKLMFSEDHLPEWASEDEAIEQTNSAIRPRDFSGVFEAPKVSIEAQEDDRKIQEEFRKAIEEAKAKDAARENSMTNAVADTMTETVSEGLQSAKNKLSGLADKYLKPHFIEGTEGSVDLEPLDFALGNLEDKIEVPVQKEITESTDAIKEAAALAVSAKKKRTIIKSTEEESARALKPFVFKNLKEERSI